METPHSLEMLVEVRINWMKHNHYARQTYHEEGFTLRRFQRWCEAREITRPQEVTPALLESFKRYLYYAKDKDGQRTSPGYQHRTLGKVKRMFQWALKQGFLLVDPSAFLECPRLPEPLPKQVLTAVEMEKVLALPKIKRATGLRDRAVLEVFYATAMRRNELIQLNPGDLDRDRRLVWIRKGKGSKDRVVPITQRALDWVDRYEREVREPWLIYGKDEGMLFLGAKGNPLNTRSCSGIATRYIQKAVPHKKGSCHLIRHTVATLFLENGADIRHIQELLGHKQIRTTQIYTRVSPTHLKEVYQRCHPSQFQKK